VGILCMVGCCVVSCSVCVVTLGSVWHYSFNSYYSELITTGFVGPHCLPPSCLSVFRPLRPVSWPCCRAALDRVAAPEPSFGCLGTLTGGMTLYGGRVQDWRVEGHKGGGLVGWKEVVDW